MTENTHDSALEGVIQPGDRVCLSALPPYFKTADPMPMLRPPDLVAIDEIGVVIEARPSRTWAVKFNRGVFLIDEKYIALASTNPDVISDALSTAPSP